MAKNDKWLRQQYFKALTALGEKLTGRERLNTYKKKWKALREDYKTKGLKPPSLYSTAKDYSQEESLTEAFSEWYDEHRDEYMNTEPAQQDLDMEKAQEDIDLFEWTIEQIYRETLTYIDENQKGVGHDQGKLASIAQNRISDIDAMYWQLKEQLQSLKNSGIPLPIIAQAIKDNVELDYTIGISLSPPSDLVIEFETTLEQLNGIQAQINERASELAEQAEREYYGQ